MEEIKRQVSRARRRMVLQQFLGVVIWTMFATMLIALVALAVPKIFVLSVDWDQWWNAWLWSWIGGAVGAGLVAAMLWTYLIRSRPLEAAVEIDRRYGLKERVSSALSMHPSELDSEAGRALMSDAQRRIERIHVGEHFGISLNWRALLPLVPVLALLGVILLPNRLPEQVAAAKESEAAAKRQIEAVTKKLKDRIEEKRKQAAEDGLKEAEVLFKKVEEGIRDLNSKGESDRKRAMVRLNDLKKEIENRRRQLGDRNQMRKNLDQLKNMAQGPADKAVKAMREGNFNKALEEIKDLKEQIKNGNLNEEQRKQLAEQLQEMADKLKNLADAHDQAKRDLEEQIEQAEKAGDQAKADQLQQKLERLSKQDQQMNRLSKMADKLGKCSQCLQPGNGKKPSPDELAQAGEALDDVTSQLQDMQRELDELESLDDVMDQIAEAKNAMNCDKCGGKGCKQCDGGGFGQGQGDKPGFGLGDGQGQGARPEEETDKKFYQSQVRGKVKSGEAVVTGEAGGPNAAGLTREEAKAEIGSEVSKESDPLTNQPLPRKIREHVKQYNKQYGEGR